MPWATPMPPTLPVPSNAGPACARATSVPGKPVSGKPPGSVDAQNLVHLQGQAPLRMGQAVIGRLAGIALFDRIIALVRHRGRSHRRQKVMPGPDAQKALRWGQRLRKDQLQFITLRSEEHTSELQSRPHLVCRLLLE